MAVSRYDKPAKMELIDTFVPFPYQQVQHALEIKQKKFDDTKEALDKLPAYLQADLPDYYEESTGVKRKNTSKEDYYKAVNQYNDEINQIKSDLISNKDISTANKRMNEVAGKINSFMNGEGGRIKQEADLYKKWRGEFEKDNERGLAGTQGRYLEGDLAIRQQEKARRGEEGNLNTYTFGTGMAYNDINKKIRETAKDVGLDTESKEFLNVVKDFQNEGIDGILKQSQKYGGNYAKIATALLPIIEEHEPYLQKEALSDISYIMSKDKNNKYNPNDINDIYKYATENKVKLKNGKEITLFDSLFNEKRSKLFNAGQMFGQQTSEFKQDLNTPSFMNSGKSNKIKDSSAIQTSFGIGEELKIEGYDGIEVDDDGNLYTKKVLFDPNDNQYGEVMIAPREVNSKDNQKLAEQKITEFSLDMHKNNPEYVKAFRDYLDKNNIQVNNKKFNNLLFKKFNEDIKNVQMSALRMKLPNINTENYYTESVVNNLPNQIITSTPSTKGLKAGSEGFYQELGAKTKEEKDYVDKNLKVIDIINTGDTPGMFAFTTKDLKGNRRNFYTNGSNEQIKHFTPGWDLSKTLKEGKLGKNSLNKTFVNNKDSGSNLIKNGEWRSHNEFDKNGKLITIVYRVENGEAVDVMSLEKFNKSLAVDWFNSSESNIPGNKKTENLDNIEE